MTDVTRVDPDFLDRLSAEFRTEAQELATHASWFTACCERVGDAYGALPESYDSARQYASAVSSMSDHLESRVIELRSHADALAAAARCYRDADRVALAESEGWSLVSGARTVRVS